MLPEIRPKVAFYGFELDLETGDLTLRGEPVRLAAQPARALVLLVERAGELVPRNDIQQHVWGELIIEQEQGLNTCIRQIRSALGDRSGSPRFIETVPRRGYRFIAPITECGPPKPDAPPATVLPNRPRESSRSLLAGRRWILALPLLAVLAFSSQMPRQGPSPANTLAASTAPARSEVPGAPIPQRSVLAVFPFEGLGGQVEERIFALGLTEEILTELTRLDPDGLGILSRTSVASYGESGSVEASLHRLGETLGADFVLRGSVRHLDGTARIAVHLVRIADGSHVWAERYDRPAEDAFRVQLEVARQVVQSIAPALLPPEMLPAELRKSASRAAATDPRAWEAYLRGLYLLKTSDPPEPRRARDELRRALELDPGLALAHVALADSYHAERRSGTLAQQRQALVQALELDPDLAAAHVRLAKIQLYADWDFEAAERSFERAVELAPGDADIRQNYAVYLSHLRRHEEAIEHLEQARRLDPISATVHGDGGDIYFAARRYEKAVELCRKTLELEPGHYPARTCLLHAYRRLGRHAQARQQAVEVMRLLGADEAQIAPVDRDDDSQQALTGFFEWQAGWLRGQNAPPVAMAAAVLPLGRVDEVFTWLERAYDQHSGTLLAIAADPRADAFREDPRFVDLLHRIGFPAETIER